MSLEVLEEILYDLGGLHSLPAGLTNGSTINLNITTNVTNKHNPAKDAPQNIGTLPLDQFIYIIIGVLVFLCCSSSLWYTFKAMKSPRYYFPLPTFEDNVQIDFPFKKTKPPIPVALSVMVRGEVGKLRSQTIYKMDGSLPPSLIAEQNLPLPVVGEKGAQNQQVTAIDAVDIETWGALVEEKEVLNTKIANLERLEQARKESGAIGAIDPRLLAALERRGDVENLVNAAYERFQQRRGDFTMEEWQMIESIMHSRRR